MDETTQATRAKDEFFSAGMHMFHVTGFTPPQDVLTRKADAPPGARLDVWRTEPASDRHIQRRDTLIQQRLRLYRQRRHTRRRRTISYGAVAACF
jgi:hypothetical protein